jgi:two-component system, OmpR family, response regulator
MKVLLVDDEQKFTQMLTKRLELRGIKVRAFFSGEKALEAVELGGCFDIAILDIKMPGIGGIELKQRLSKLAPNAKFVFLTGHGTDRDKITWKADEQNYLPKPLKIDDLMEILERLNGERKERNDS